MPAANERQKWTILGQDANVLVAVASNLLSWFVSSFFPSFMPRLLPKCEQEEGDYSDKNAKNTNDNNTKCISIGRPGGLEQLRLISLKSGICTKGYNVRNKNNNATMEKSPFMNEQDMPPDCVLVRVKAFSVNYADCCIRWGLYESANQFVGYPIVPGFDIAGVIERVGGKSSNSKSADSGGDSSSSFKVGDCVFGCTLFGAYSNRAIVPAVQLRKIPQLDNNNDEDNNNKLLSMVQAASVPAVSLTALYALQLAGHYPHKSPYRNRAILIHSASGGVGGMLVQMSKLLGLSPIVGVVGTSAKVETALSLGCHVVIDKSQEGDDLWEAVRKASPEGYITVMDSNGVSTLMDSYRHLCSTGRVVVFGFHSNLPMGKDMLSPWQWFRMAQKMSKMPKFDPMDMVVSSKSVMGFNLSFFSEEKELVGQLFDQVCDWIRQGKIQCPPITHDIMDMAKIGQAHTLIMSGKTVGKIVLTTT